MILDNTFPPDPRVENEALSLIQNGHEVFLFCFDYTGDLEQKETINGIKIYRRKVSKLEYKLSALAYTVPFYHFLMQKEITEFAVKNSIEAFHIHDIQIARSVFNVNKKLNLPAILDLHENRPEIMKYYAHVRSFPGNLLISPDKWKEFEYHFILNAEKVIVVTNEAKRYYSANIPVEQSKFCVVPNSVRKDFYQKTPINNNIVKKYAKYFTMLYIGDTGLRRGLKTAIASLQYVKKEIPNIKLAIVGKSKDDQYLKEMVKNLDLEKEVDFQGWQETKLLPSYIAASDIGLCPIHRNIHHDTTYANKVFQHLSFGKPMIVSNATAQAELIERNKCGLVFEDRNSRQLADQIIRISKNADLYTKLSKNGKTAIENHLNWEVSSKELIKLYESL